MATVDVAASGTGGEVRAAIGAQERSDGRESGVEVVCGRARSQDFVLTDTQQDVATDADAAALRDGATLVLVFAGNRALAAPARETISFQP